MRILISRLSALGDVVCTLPVATAIKKQFPESEIVWVADPRFAGVVECCPAVDQVVKVKPGFAPKTWPRRLGLGTFDYALDMQGLTKSALVIAFATSNQKLGYHWQRELARLFSQPVQPDPSSLHVVDQYLDVARAIGVEVHEAEFGLEPNQICRENMKDALNQKGIQGPFVVMNGGAGWITKRWNPEHFATLIDLLAERSIQTVLIGGKSEDDLAVAKTISDQCHSAPISMVGATNIPELIALISLANAHVGGDTGSSHIAAALNVPSIGLYSITKPVRSCPYGQIDRVHYNPAGLNYILPQEVFQTVMRCFH